MTNLARLLGIMARLRDPQTGCPWDLRQTFATIAPHTIEEAYEVADAIERDNAAELREELGDLLFQVVFYARLGEEQQRFDFEQIAAAISDKLERRHPHVFGNAQGGDEGVRARDWEAHKRREREQKRAGATSQMDDVAKALPELLRAHQFQKRAALVGFDWPRTADGIAEDVFAKIVEELTETRQALSEAHPDHIQEEIGDLLFAVVNLARHADVSAENALRRANRKFAARFRSIEARLASQGRQAEDCDLKELDALWEAVKHDSCSRD